MGLLPHHLKPLPDELLTSWLVRLAYANGAKLHTFCTYYWPRHVLNWARDPDRSCSSDVLSTLACLTGTTWPQAHATTLDAYAGWLTESIPPSGSARWILQIGRGTRTRRLPGQQFCPRCLRTGTPYFRRHWRLALSTVCVQHAMILQDRCPHCGAVVSFHEGDYRSKVLAADLPIRLCHHCHDDLAEERPGVSREASVKAVDFQQLLLATLEAGWITFPAGQVTYSTLYFDGLHILLRLLASSGREASRLLAHLKVSAGELPLPLAFPGTAHYFENLPVADRYDLLLHARELLQEWPGVFVGACRLAGVSSSYVLGTRVPAPYWFSDPVRAQLDALAYRPTLEEWQAAAHHLEKRNVPVTSNAVTRLLGKSPIPKRAFMRRITTQSNRIEGGQKPYSKEAVFSPS